MSTREFPIPLARLKQAGRSRKHTVWHELGRDRLASFAVATILLVVLVAILAPVLAPHDPASQDLANRLKPPFWMAGGSLDYLLGTDSLGRDVLSRTLFGSRASLIVGFSVMALSGLIGTVLGTLGGFFGGWADSLIMRAIDIQFSFPGLLLMMAILWAVGPSYISLIIVLSLNAWMVFGRTIRAAVLSIRQSPYVEAAHVIGCRSPRIIFRHIIPNLSGPILTLSVLGFANAVLNEAALSFLGIGIQPPETSWGLDVSVGREYIFSAWWLVTVPGLAIVLTVLAANLLASWVRVMTDPVERSKRFATRSIRMFGAGHGSN